MFLHIRELVTKKSFSFFLNLETFSPENLVVKNRSSVKAKKIMKLTNEGFFMM